MKPNDGRLVLISCVSQKLSHAAPARDLYTSPWFMKALAYAEHLHPDAIYILSAEYGLVDLDTVIAPYDKTLNRMAAVARRLWARRVLEELGQRADLDQTHVTLLAGTRYREHLIPALKSYDIPMEALTIGRQLQFLSERTHD